MKWLMILNNFSGVTFIKISPENRWKESKFLKFYAIFKFFYLIILFLSFHFINGLTAKVFKSNNNLLKNYSTFSKSVLRISVNYFYIYSFVMIVVQYYRRREVMSFLKAIESFEMTRNSRKSLKIRYIMNTAFNVGVFMSGVLIRETILYDITYFPTYIICFGIIQSNLIIYVTFNFICNFQHLIALALREVRENLQKYILNYENLEICLKSFDKIEKLIKNFENIFGLQLTLISVNVVFSVVTFVSMPHLVRRILEN